MRSFHVHPRDGYGRECLDPPVIGTTVAAIRRVVPAMEIGVPLARWVEPNAFRRTELADLCGRAVSVLAGSTFEASLAKAQPRCPAAGRPPIEVRSYPDGATAQLALAQRRADVTMSTINGLRYLVSQQPRLRFVNEYRRLDVGFALAKDSPLIPAVHAAVSRLMADGTYARILAKWGTPTSCLLYTSDAADE